jgi:hypothetical protein
MAGSGAGPFREGNQTDLRIERSFGTARHDFQAFARGSIGDRDVAEPPHHPTIDGDFEMRLQLETPQELRNGRVNHKRIEYIDVVANEYVRPLGIKSWRLLHVESDTRETQDISKERSLRPVVFSRIDEDGKTY